MRKLITLLLFILVPAASAFAASGTIEDMIAQLEGKDQETIAHERQERHARDEEKFAEELENERAALQDKLWTTENAHDTVAYRSRKTPVSTLSVKGSIYFILHDSGSNLSLECRYGFIEDNWIFLKSIKVDIDGETYFVRLDGASKKPRHGWEYFDAPVTLNDEAFYQKIINSQTTMIYFLGVNDSVVDFKVSGRQKEALSEVLRFYYIRQYQLKDISMEQYLEKAAKIKL